MTPKEMLEIGADLESRGKREGAVKALRAAHEYVDGPARFYSAGAIGVWLRDRADEIALEDK